MIAGGQTEAVAKFVEKTTNKDIRAAIEGAIGSQTMNLKANNEGLIFNNLALMLVTDHELLGYLCSLETFSISQHDFVSFTRLAPLSVGAKGFINFC